VRETARIHSKSGWRAFIRQGSIQIAGRKEMGILSWIILGLIAGALAKFILPGDDPGGLILTIILGIVGAIVGGLIASALGLGGITGLNIGSILIAILGAIILLLLYRLVVGRSTA
jgi:uncharacterized membrane protein YeaQ/YmgE (transglycosylase-associated protein family)